MQKVFILIVFLLLILSLSACEKKEPQQPVQQAPAPMGTGPILSEPVPPGQMPPSMTQQGQQPEGQGMMMQRVKTKIVVPESVKGKWSGARIIFEDKVAKTKQEYLVKLNSEFKIPNTNLNLHVGDFLPDFKMDGMTLTSSTNQPKNPALSVQVFENNKKIFPASGKQWGWLFAKVPAIHPFEHPKYSIFLKEGVKK
ncbi:MAG: hypothetical protein HXY53_05580 [Nitrospirae bacterium]|nr:hypothetical protein [Nitrospirota bacterium]